MSEYLSLPNAMVRASVVVDVGFDGLGLGEVVRIVLFWRLCLHNLIIMTLVIHVAMSTADSKIL